MNRIVPGNIPRWKDLEAFLVEAFPETKGWADVTAGVTERNDGGYEVYLECKDYRTGFGMGRADLDNYLQIKAARELIEAHLKEKEQP